MANDPTTAAVAPARDWRRELSGAFGDLGTLVPYIVAYLVVVGMDAGIVFLSFGAALIASGLYYRLPIPVQPMKAIGAAAAAHASQQVVVTPGSVALSALITGAFWLLASHSGLARRAAEAVPRDVTKGIVMGVGVALVLEALRQLQGDWLVGLAMVAVLLALNARSRISPFLLIVVAGIAIGAWRRPDLVERLATMPFAMQWPRWSQPDWSSPQLWMVALLLALPQIPLTFGNAVAGTAEETRREFPGSSVDEGRLARSTGWMNLWAGVIGGPPMCHGSGGFAGYLAAGARTGWPVGFPRPAVRARGGTIPGGDRRGADAGAWRRHRRHALRGRPLHGNWYRRQQPQQTRARGIAGYGGGHHLERGRRPDRGAGAAPRPEAPLVPSLASLQPSFRKAPDLAAGARPVQGSLRHGLRR